MNGDNNAPLKGTWLPSAMGGKLLSPKGLLEAMPTLPLACPADTPR